MTLPLNKRINLLSARAELYSVILLAILILCTAFAAFSTKGEPREALVAVEMLRTGNWILPIDLSGDMAYKPPMFHWLIALFSLPAGHVTELTARLPSVVALTALFLISIRFFGQRSRNIGVLAAMLSLTTFEMFRAGTVCRVDMVLVFFITAAIMALYKSLQNSGNSKVWYIMSIAAMSCGTLTKGPVGIILPLGIYWLFALTRGVNFWRTTLITIGLAIGSLILPAVWYYAAWEQGGNRFLTLALEENFGRFMGTMSYESHVKPFWYNITSLLLGTLPWGIVFIASLCVGKFWQKLDFSGIWKRFRGLDPLTQLSLIAAVAIFVFYSIPKSKRSVYLLPMYPYMAYGAALYCRRLVTAGKMTVRTVRLSVGIVFCLFVAGFGVAFPIIASGISDKGKAKEIEAISPSGPIYSYIPDRFLRYYITDFYLGGRIVSLIPSMQVDTAPGIPIDSRRLSSPPADEFMLITPEESVTLPHSDARSIYGWLDRHELKAERVYTSSEKARDIKSKIVLLRITRQ